MKTIGGEEHFVTQGILNTVIEDWVQVDPISAGWTTGGLDWTVQR